MNENPTIELLSRYYAAFNRGDWEGMLACLSDDIAHDINQGERQVGNDRFRTFMAHMERCYRERLEDIALMVDGNECVS